MLHTSLSRITEKSKSIVLSPNSLKSSGIVQPAWPDMAIKLAVKSI